MLGTTLLSEPSERHDRPSAPRLFLNLLITSLVILLSIRLLIYVLAARFGKKLKIGSFGWVSVSDVMWEGKEESDGSRTRVKVRKIGLAFGDFSKGHKGLIGLKMDGVRIVVPDRVLAGIGKKSGSGSGSGSGSLNNSPNLSRVHSRQGNVAVGGGIVEQVQSSAPNILQRTAGYLKSVLGAYLSILRFVISLIYETLPESVVNSISKFYDQFRQNVLSPSWRGLNSFGRRFSFLVAIGVAEVKDLEVDIGDIARIKGTARAGMELVRGKDSRVGAWIKFESVFIDEGPASSSKAPAGPSKLGPTAFGMARALEISATAPLDPTIGLGGLWKERVNGIELRPATVDIKVVFPGPTKRRRAKKEGGSGGVEVRLDGLKRIALSLPFGKKGSGAGAGREAEAATKVEDPPAPESESDDEQGTSDEETSEASSSKHLNEDRDGPLACLRSFYIEIPQLNLTAHHEPAPSTRERQPRLASSVTLDTLVNGLKAEMRFGSHCMQGGGKTGPPQHEAWFGKSTFVKARAKVGWERLRIRLGVNSKPAEDEPHLLEVGESALFLSTTWLPPKVDELFLDAVSARQQLGSLDYPLLVCETDFGSLQGQVAFDRLAAALQALKARSRFRKSHRDGSAQQTDPKPKPKARQWVRDIPNIVGSMTSRNSTYRIFGPKAPHELGYGPGEDAGVERPWSSTDALCFTLPYIVISVDGTYQELTSKPIRVERRTASRKSDRVPENEDELTIRAKKLHSTFQFPYGDHTMRYRVEAGVLVSKFDVYFLSGTKQQPIDKLPFSTSRPSGLRAQEKFELLSIGPIDLSYRHSILGVEDYSSSPNPVPCLNRDTREGNLVLAVNEMTGDLWRPQVMASIHDMLQAVSDDPDGCKPPESKDSPQSQQPDHSSPQPLVASCPRDIQIYIGIAHTSFRIAGPDPKCDPDICRGISIDISQLTMEYTLQTRQRKDVLGYPERQSLELTEDIRLQANALLSQGKGSPGLFKAGIKELLIGPVLDANSAEEAVRGCHVDDETNDHSSATNWEFKDRAILSNVDKRHSTVRQEDMPGIQHVLQLPAVTVRATLSSGQSKAKSQEPSLGDLVISAEAGLTTARADVMDLYCCLLAASALRSLPPKKVLAPKKQEHEPTKGDKPKLTVALRFEFPEFHIFLTLPHNVPLFWQLRRGQVQISPTIGIEVLAESLMVAGLSPTISGRWDDLVRARTVKVAFRPEPGNDGWHTSALYVDGDSLRVKVPFKYVVSRIIDNIAMLVKTLKQLAHQFIKGGYGSIIEPEAEAAKRLPKISVSFKIVAIEAQDDPFETRLNIIWRAGYQEQEQRLNRDKAFNDKVKAIERAGQKAGAASDSGTASGYTSSSEEEESYRHKDLPRMSAAHNVPVSEATNLLRARNSTEWTKRIRNATAEQGRREEALLRRLYGLLPGQRRDQDLPIHLLSHSRSAPLLRITAHNLSVVVTKPSFGADEGLRDFLFDVGKGMPRDTEFTVLVPVHLKVTASEVKATLRDYPLPLVHIPPAPPGQGPAFDLETDLVAAEELPGPEGILRVPSVVIPKLLRHKHEGPYTIEIPRTVRPMKTYALPVIKIRSSEATTIGWGNSMQPAIQDVVRVLDSLTKISPDPSEKLGPWDKVRLVLHWKLKVVFEGDADVLFIIKGTRDPYELLGFGAGFMMCWRDNVRFLVGFNNPDREFFQVESDKYLLGIPDLRSYEDNAAAGGAKENVGEEFVGPRTLPNQKDKLFYRLCGKFNNGVRWGMGMIMERTCQAQTCKKCTGRPFERKCRFFDFKPHHSVVTHTVHHAFGPDGKKIDSFAGFRSDFVHFSISITSPTKQVPDGDNIPESKPYNSLLFAPRSLKHFFSWWHLFDSSMSLPIRQGKLFPSAQPPSKKFGRHCATIKYRFSIAPLFIAHAYRQDQDKEDIKKGKARVLGVKGKIARFNVDLHQRSQEESVYKPEMKMRRKRMRKAFYQAEVDCEGVDLRVIEGVFNEPELKVVLRMDEDEDVNADSPSEDDLTISYDDLEWHDRVDFLDLFSTLLDLTPRIRVLRCLTCPRFTYYRQPPNRMRLPGSYSDRETDSSEIREEEDMHTKFGQEDSHTCFIGQTRGQLQQEGEHAGLPAGSKSNLYEADQPWINRIVVHSPTVFISNDIRTLALKYYYSSRRSKGNSYQLSPSPLKFIRELSNELAKKGGSPVRHRSSTTPASHSESKRKRVHDILDEMMAGPSGSTPEDGIPDSSARIRQATDANAEIDPSSGLCDEYSLEESYLVTLHNPQFALHSQIDSKSKVIITTSKAELEVYSVLDDRFRDDPVNSHVMHRSYIRLKEMQAFYPSESVLDDFLPDDVSQAEPAGFDRIVSKTDALIRYDKFNQLRVSNSTGVVRRSSKSSKDPARDDHLETGTDLVAVDCDKLSVTANPMHFAALYNVVFDLILYHEPGQKARQEKIETMLFTYDFSDLAGMVDIIASLQTRIRHHQTIAMQYEEHVEMLDKDGLSDMISHHWAGVQLAEELSFIMAAVNAAQDQAKGSDSGKKSGVQVEARAAKIDWFMNGANDAAIAKFTVSSVLFSWLSKKDSTVSNRLVIGDIEALSPSPDAVFPEILQKYTGSPDHPLCKSNTFVVVLWNVLAPVGGISIIDQLEVHLHPLSLQIEHKVGRQIMDYVFAQRRNLKKLKEEDNSKSNDRSRANSSETRRSGKLTPRPQPSRSNSQTTRKSMESSRPSRSALDIESSNAASSSNSTFSFGGSKPKLRKVASSGHLRKGHNGTGGLDAEEMRARAALNRTFIMVDIAPTTLCLSYKGQKDSNLMDIYKIVYRSPSFQYRNRIWSYLDLMNHLKKDVIKSVWSQSGALVTQLITSYKRKDAPRSAPKKSFASQLKLKLRSSSKLSSSSTTNLLQDDDGETTNVSPTSTKSSQAMTKSSGSPGLRFTVQSPSPGPSTAASSIYHGTEGQHPKEGVDQEGSSELRVAGTLSRRKSKSETDLPRFAISQENLRGSPEPIDLDDELEDDKVSQHSSRSGRFQDDDDYDVNDDEEEVGPKAFLRSMSTGTEDEEERAEGGDTVGSLPISSGGRRSSDQHQHQSSHQIRSRKGSQDSTSHEETSLSSSHPSRSQSQSQSRDKARSESMTSTSGSSHHSSSSHRSGTLALLSSKLLHRGLSTDEAVEDEEDEETAKRRLVLGKSY